MFGFIKKYFWLFVIIVALGIFFFHQKTVVAENSSSIATAIVTQGDFIRKVTSSGKTFADRAVDVKFQTSGRLSWVGVQEGDIVQKGEPLAGLDSREVQKNLQKSLRDYSRERNDFDESKEVTYGNKKPTDGNDTLKRILENNQWDLEKAVLDVELKISRLSTPPSFPQSMASSLI